MTLNYLLLCDRCQPIQRRPINGECRLLLSSVVTSSEFFGNKLEGKGMIGKNPQNIVNFQQESGTPDKVGPREGHHVSEEGIHKAAERITFLANTAPFQLPLFLQSTPGKEYLCPQSFP